MGDFEYKMNQKLGVAKQAVIPIPEVKAVRYQEGDDDFVLLTSDGVTDVMENWEIVKFVRWRLKERERDWRAAISDLFNLSLQRYSCDNMSLVIIDLNSQGRYEVEERRNNHKDDG